MNYFSLKHDFRMHANVCSCMPTCYYYIFLSPLAMHSHNQSSKKHRSCKFLFPCLLLSPFPIFPSRFHPSPRPLCACCALRGASGAGQGAAGWGAGRPGGAFGEASGGGGSRGAPRGTGGGSVSETVGSGRPWRPKFWLWVSVLHWMPSRLHICGDKNQFSKTQS